MRVNIILENTELKGERVYLTEKNRRNNPDRLELKNIVQNYVKFVSSKR